MSNLFILLKNSFINNSGINSLKKGTANNKENKKLLFTTVTIILIGILICTMSAGYSVAIGTALKEMGHLDLLLVIAAITSSLISFFMSIYKAQGFLFSSKDYELLMSLPVKTSTILGSKIISMLSINIIITTLVLVPAGIVYYIFNGSLSWVYFLLLIIGIILISLLPLIMASLFAVIITFISSRFKHKNIAITIIGMLFFIFIMFISMNMNTYANSFMKNSKEIVESISGIYPPAIYFKETLVNNDYISLLKLVMISVIPFLAFIGLFNKTYKTINGKLSETYKKANYKIKGLKISSPLKAILIQELRRYIATPIYVMNTAIGPIIMLIASISTLFIGKDTIDEILGYSEMSNVIPVILLNAFMFLIGLSCTTNSSISLEGNRLWIIKSLPIDVKTIFKGKILMNLVITVPAIIISNIVIAIGIKLSIKYLIINIIITNIFALLSSILGLLINLYFPKMEWSNPTSVVKQSAAVLVTILSTIGVVIICAGLFILLRNSVILYLLAVLVVLSVLVLTVWNILIVKGIEKFKAL